MKTDLGVYHYPMDYPDWSGVLVALDANDDDFVERHLVNRCTHLPQLNVKDFINYGGTLKHRASGATRVQNLPTTITEEKR